MHSTQKSNIALDAINHQCFKTKSCVVDSTVFKLVIGYRLYELGMVDADQCLRAIDGAMKIKLYCYQNTRVVWKYGAASYNACFGIYVNTWEINMQ